MYRTESFYSPSDTLHFMNDFNEKFTLLLERIKINLSENSNYIL